jgi:hypothetical protein
VAVTKRKNSRQKGKRGELDAADALRRLFSWTTRRTQQFKGTSDSSDVEVAETPDAFWEIKREERLNVFKAMDTAAAEAGPKLPILMHRRNRTDWLVTVRLADLARLAQIVTRAGQAVTDPDQSEGN